MRHWADTRDVDSDSGPTFGVYHPGAGVRSSGGVAVYVQESVPELARNYPTYCYTREGDPARDLAASAATVVTVPRDPPVGAFGTVGSLGARLARQVVSGSVAESLSFFLDARASGALDDLGSTVDVLFTHDAIDTLLLTNAVDVPVVRVYHSFDGRGAAGNLVGRLSRPAATVANAPITARRLASELGVAVDGIAYPGVDLGTFSPTGPVAFDSENVVVLFVGLLIESKGVFDLLGALAALPDAVAASVELVLVGRGDRERVVRECAMLGIEEQVRLVGEVSHATLAEYYRAADVCCLPTHNETFGMVNLEAMACGTPVLTTDLPGIRRYATDGESCLLVPPGDVPALTSGLDALVTSPARRAKLRRGGRRVARTFTWRATAERLARIGSTVGESAELTAR